MRHADSVEEASVLGPLGIELSTDFSVTEDDLIRNGQGTFGFLVSHAPVTRRVMEALPDLAIVIKYGVGIDNIDVEAARELGKTVAHVPDYATEEVALHALALATGGMRIINAVSNAVRDGNWIEDPSPYRVPRGSELDLGLIGFGRIARRFAMYMKPVVRRIFVCDPFLEGPALQGYDVARVVGPADLFARCGVVSIHAPLTPQTRNMVNQETLSHANDCILVNTARAGLIDRHAILPALESGRLRHFATDVFWDEPADFSDPLTAAIIDHPGVVVTPHIAWYSQASEQQLRRDAAMEMARAIRGERLLNSVTGAIKRGAL